MFDEDKVIEEGQTIIKKIEKSLRQLKIDYQKALSDYNKLKEGDSEVFENLESQHLNLLSKFQTSIEETTDLWDRAIASVGKMRAQKKIKADFFLTGVIWSLDEANVEMEKKKEIIEIAKKLISKVS